MIYGYSYQTEEVFMFYLILCNRTSNTKYSISDYQSFSEVNN